MASVPRPSTSSGRGPSSGSASESVPIGAWREDNLTRNGGVLLAKIILAHHFGKHQPQFLPFLRARAAAQRQG